MSNKELFMQYAKKRLKEKEYARRKFLSELGDVQVRGFERCSKGRYSRGQK